MDTSVYRDRDTTGIEVELQEERAGGHESGSVQVVLREGEGASARGVRGSPPLPDAKFYIARAPPGS